MNNWLIIGAIGAGVFLLLKKTAGGAPTGNGINPKEINLSVNPQGWTVDQFGRLWA